MPHSHPHHQLWCCCRWYDAGIVPPYQHFEPALDRVENDWRWAAGATPFGPYSNYEGVSEIMQVGPGVQASMIMSSGAVVLKDIRVGCPDAPLCLQIFQMYNMPDCCVLLSQEW